MKKLIKILSVGVVFFPAVALAQLGQTQILVGSIGDLVQILIMVAAGAALLVFFWGLAKFILKIGGDEKAVAQGKTLMIWGLLSLFVMISVWGLVRFLQDELLSGVDFDNPTLPNFK